MCGCVLWSAGKLLLDDDISATDFDDIQPQPVTGAIQKKIREKPNVAHFSGS